MKKITIRDIAKIAGVSTTTVSRSINYPHLIRPETLKRIQKAIKKEQYVYDAVAADLSKRKSKIIGLITPTINLTVFARTTHGIQEWAQEKGYFLIIACSNFSAQVELDLLKLMEQRRVAGIIIAGLSGGESSGRVKEYIKYLNMNGTPCVVTWEIFEDRDINYVGINHFKAGYTMTDYLIKLNHKRIGLITGPSQRAGRIEKRLEGYRAALNNGDIEYDPALVIERDFSVLNGKEAMKQLISLPNPPTAVFANNDVLAIGALSVARELGLRVPDDISIVGLGDIDFAGEWNPPLTTIRLPSFEMGNLAIKTLLELIESNPKQGQQFRQYCLDTDLIIRASASVVKDTEALRSDKTQLGGKI